MMDNSAIYQHFRPEERPLIDNLATLIAQAENEYRPILTHFLDPRQCYIANTLVKRNGGVKISEQGAYPDAQRKRLIFYPPYYEVQASDFEIAILEINYPVKFATLKHNQILGTLLNSGLNREVFGDIIHNQQRWQVVVQANVAMYLINEVQKIGAIKVNLQQTQDVLQATQIDWQKEQETVSSLRVDNVIAELYHISRKHAKELILAKKVQLNWMTLPRVDYELAQYDLISVRGYGRIQIDEVLGMSKKGKIKLEVSILRKK